MKTSCSHTGPEQPSTCTVLGEPGAKASTESPSSTTDWCAAVPSTSSDSIAGPVGSNTVAPAAWMRRPLPEMRKGA